MMNEFPQKYFEVMREASDSDTPPVNVTEYLEYLDSLGVREQDFPAIQPIMQKRIWDRARDTIRSRRVAESMEQLRKEDNRFHMEGGSWTNNISWVRGYADVLGRWSKPAPSSPRRPRGFRHPNNVTGMRLFHLLTTQTSCYRYWGTGFWTDYARELCRRTNDILNYDF